MGFLGLTIGAMFEGALWKLCHKYNIVTCSIRQSKKANFDQVGRQNLKVFWYFSKSIPLVILQVDSLLSKQLAVSGLHVWARYTCAQTSFSFCVGWQVLDALLKHSVIPELLTIYSFFCERREYLHFDTTFFSAIYTFHSGEPNIPTRKQAWIIKQRAFIEGSCKIKVIPVRPHVTGRGSNVALCKKSANTIPSDVKCEFEI